MRRRIWRISEDRFDDEKPILTSTPESISTKFYLEKAYQGEFTLISNNEVNARGIIYSSNPYVRCLDPQFDGVTKTIRYELAKATFSTQDVVEGYFAVIYNMGELKIPYRFTFTREKFITDLGEIHKLEDLARIAEKDMDCAHKLFLSNEFQEFMQTESIEQRLLYRGFLAAIPSKQNFENYLSASGLKETVVFDAVKDKQFFYGIHQDEQGTIELSRNTWGYLRIQVECDAPFIELQASQITDSDFLGRGLNYHYFIKRNRLHDGRNVGHITFLDGRTSITIEIEANIHEKDAWNYYSYNLKKQKEILTASQDYFKYRFGQISEKTWIHQILSSADRIQAILKDRAEEANGFLQYQENPWINLIRCYAHILNNDRQEALYMIRELRMDIQDHASPEWAALLYICTLIEPEEDYKIRLTIEIERIFRSHPEDVRIFLLLLHLRTEYAEDPALKLKAIRQWVLNGYYTPFLYIEAFDLYQAHPFLLNDMNEFSFAVLSFVRRYHGFTDIIAMQLVEIMTYYTEFDNRVLRLLISCYEDCYQRDDLLKQILLYLLLGQKFDKKYLSWYLLGIQREMNITGIYEAYVYSLPEESIDPLPENVKIYFRYPSQLPYDRKALLYANCIGRKAEDPVTYREYFPEMERFAEEQMKLGRISDNLTVIYQDVLERGLMTPDGYQALSRLYYMRKAVSLRESAVKLVLYEDSMKDPRVVPIQNHIAYVPIIDKNYRIFLEDIDGTRYADTGICFVEDFLNENYEGRLERRAEDPLPFMLSRFTHRSEPIFSGDDLQLIQRLLFMPEIRQEYLESLFRPMMDYLKEKGREEVLSSYLWEHRENPVSDVALRNEMLIYGIANDHELDVYQIMKTQYALGVRQEQLLRVLNAVIEETIDQSDDFLISLSAWLFERDCCSEETIAYLNRYYTGTVDLMDKLFRHTEQDRMENTELAQRTLTQMLYTDRHDKYPEKLYLAFLRRHPNKMVAEAFLTYWSRQYLLGNVEPGFSCFENLMRIQRVEENPNDSCRIALLKYLCEKKELSEEEFRVLDDLLRFYITRNIYFGFYKKADYRLMIRYHLYDKVFVEYHGDPGISVQLTYQKNNGEDVVTKMDEMYDGIYVKQFVLFFGDTVKYQIYINDESNLPVVSDRVVGQELVKEKGDSRFNSLNRIQSALIYDEPDKLKEELKQYQKKDYMTKKLFHWI